VPLPTVSQTWTFSVNNVNTFSSVQATMQAYARALKNFLKTTMGYTTKGSCSAGTGAMDGVDRWTVDGDVSPQGASSATSQAWYVLTDGNGCDVLMAYQGGSVDVFRMSFSPGGLFVAAGTPANQPTATDECVIATGRSIVDPTASANRVFHFMGTTDKRMFRAIVHRSSAGVSLWGVEKITSEVVSPTTFSPATWGFFFSQFTYGGGSGTVQGNYSTTGGGLARVHTNQDLNIQVGGGGEAFSAVGGVSGGFWAAEKPTLQGGNGELLLPLSCTSSTTKGVGKLGTRIDWWGALTDASGTPAQGDSFDATTTNALVAIGAHVLPWNGTNAPVVA
jgi:hypothetical protein